MMKRKLFFAILGSVFITGVNAQVGIGNPTPNAGSILDLTNANNKALLLPVSNTDPSAVTSFNTEGMLFYYQSNLHLKLATGIKVITPWNYDGTPSNGLWSPSGTNVGIGIAPLASSTALLTVADAAGDVNVTGSNASIVVGDNDFNATHLLIDEDEILVKTNATTAGTLKLMEEGGTVDIRSSGADAGVTTVLTAYGSIDAKGKLKENGNDLLPVGSIIMWSGTTVPAGWALCDGGTYNLDAGGTVSVPNLLDRFIVGADISGGGNQGGAGSSNGTYALSDVGGANSVTLTAAQIPAHTHPATASSNGSHTHSYNDLTVSREDVNGSDFNNQGINGVPDNARTTGSAGLHTHTITVNANTGGGGAHENRPPYYALAYIYKL